MRDPEVEKEKMRVMGHWLDTVCAELGVDRALLAEVSGPMLDLITKVARGASRPGAPMSAFVLGLATQAGDDADQIKERIARISALVDDWAAPEGESGA